MAKKRGKRAKKTGASGGTAGGGSERVAIQGLNAFRNRLRSQRAAIDAKIGALDAALNAMGSALPTTVGLGRGRHGPREGSLKDYVSKVLDAAGDVMSVKDITDGVLKLGYKTRNKTLAKSVGIALAEMSNVRKVGRGKFRVK
jgi:hypothetical protein